jgi:hypothetical protein
LEQSFPRAVPDDVLIKHATRVLATHGFDSQTSINLVSTCRDEICRPLTEKLDRIWGSSFNISSLAGFCFCGRTGFKAAMAHAPVLFLHLLIKTHLMHVLQCTLLSPSFPEVQTARRDSRKKIQPLRNTSDDSSVKNLRKNSAAKESRSGSFPELAPVHAYDSWPTDTCAHESVRTVQGAFIPRTHARKTHISRRLNANAHERRGYATSHPEALLTRGHSCRS